MYERIAPQDPAEGATVALPPTKTEVNAPSSSESTLQLAAWHGQVKNMLKLW